MDDDARIEFETRLLFQEDTIAKLNDALVDQQRQIDQLRDTVARLIELLERQANDVRQAPRDERPPHY
jgi:SlyX protein